MNRRARGSHGSRLFEEENKQWASDPVPTARCPASDRRWSEGGEQQTRADEMGKDMPKFEKTRKPLIVTRMDAETEEGRQDTEQNTGHKTEFGRWRQWARTTEGVRQLTISALKPHQESHKKETTNGDSRGDRKKEQEDRRSTPRHTFDGN